MKSSRRFFESSVLNTARLPPPFLAPTWIMRPARRRARSEGSRESRILAWWAVTQHWPSSRPRGPHYWPAGVTWPHHWALIGPGCDEDVSDVRQIKTDKCNSQLWAFFSRPLYLCSNTKQIDVIIVIMMLQMIQTQYQYNLQWNILCDFLHTISIQSAVEYFMWFSTFSPKASRSLTYLAQIYTAAQ